jgi:NitT/TauT family transport system permease protein
MTAVAPTPPLGHRRSRLRDAYIVSERGLFGALSIVLFLVAWEGLSRGWWANLLHPLLGNAADSLRIRPIFLAAPTRIAEIAYQLYFVTGEMWRHLGLSGLEFLVAFAIAAALGIPAGLVSGRYKTLSDATDPLLAALNATPQVAFLPLVVLWVGVGLPARIFIIALLMIVPILINANAAVRTVDPKLLRLAKSVGASERQVFRTIILPASAPFLLAAVRLAIGRGMVGIVVGELYGGAIGVGVMINRAGATFHTAEVFVGVLTIVAVGLILSEIVRRVERRVEIWRPQAVDQRP